MMKFFTNILKKEYIRKPEIFLIRADGLKQYKHFEEALIEAKKARDCAEATPIEKELAIEKINEIKKMMKPSDQPFNKRM